MVSISQQEESFNATTQKRRLSVVRALGLTSGGLDSILSALVLKEQGIEVVWVNFETPFFSSDRARSAARMTGIPLRVKNITRVYVEMLKNPNCGYGTNMNPCLDCHALMLEIAGSMMTKEGFDFLFTGEVMGQRPMSQTKPSLRYVEKRSGFAGHILRPLSAKLLPPTIPEERGLVDRERLLDISGRSRKRQMELAETFGISDYPGPGGGCLLTDIGFSRRLKDLFEHQDDYEQRDFELLKHGRHFRLDNNYKVVVGRTREDNRQISRLIDPHKDIQLRMMDMPGPTVLIPFGAPEEIVREAATLCAAYSRAEDGQPARVSVKGPAGSGVLTVEGGCREKYQPYLI
ncbi:MAG: tRNA 4-thiouridine(8) synthase ThiI [Deltaproteobacteria bacterium]|nr:tRNA 4-thiouridine(8) synthase ThiI [Deltaproteobacteria bacterium]MBW1793527.1 tRNA 4-thiouridine(8) synthase ThiI [Deltaproteobacteria bacterium]